MPEKLRKLAFSLAEINETAETRSLHAETEVLSINENEAKLQHFDLWPMELDFVLLKSHQDLLELDQVSTGTYFRNYQNVLNELKMQI